MSEVKVTTPTGWELVHSVTMILSSNMVTVTYAGLPMDIVFKQDSTGEIRYIGTAQGNRWVLELMNFSNSMGEGMFDLVNFAEHDGRDLSISFFVQTLNVESNSRVMSLNFFKGPAK
jgi:phenolic acid decarboxylase